MKQRITNFFRNEAIPVLCIFFIIVVAYGRVLFEKQRIALGEAISFWSYGLAAVQRSLLTFHQFPLWDNTIGSGYTLLGHPKLLQFYPLIYPFLFIRDPLVLTRFFIIAQLFCGAIFFYIFLRWMKVNRVAILFGVVAYTCNFYVLTNIIDGFFAELNTLTWLPFILFFIILALQKRNLWYVFLASLGFSMLVFGGALFGVHYVLIGVAVFLLGYCIMTKEVRLVLLVAILFYLFSFLFSAIKLFPILEYTNVSIRNTIPLSVAEGNVTPGYIKFIIKMLLTTSYFVSGSIGAIMGQWLLNMPFFLLVALSVFSRWRVVVYPMLLVTGIAIIGAFGKAFPVDVYAFFYHVVPGFKSQQYTARFLLLTWFTFPFLAAIGLDSLLGVRVHLNRLLVPVTLSVLAVIGMYFIISEQKYLIDTFAFPKYASLNNSRFLTSHKKELSEYRVYNDVLLGGDSNMMTNYASLWKGYQTTMPLYGGMIPENYLIEPLWFNRDSITPYRTVDQTNRLLMVLNTKYLLVKPGSAYGDKKLQTIEEYKDANGVAVGQMDRLGATRSRWEFYPSGALILGQDASDFANFHKARKIMIGSQFDVLQSSVFTSEDNFIDDYNLQTLKIFPEIFVVGKPYNNGQQAAKILQEYKSQGGKIIDWSKNNTVRVMPGGVTNNTFTSNIHNVIEDPGLLKLTFSLNKPGLFAYSNLYYPGWEAYLDGRRTKIFMADSLVKGVVIATGGQHTLVLKYQPLSFLLGIMVSGGSLAAVLAIFLLGRFRWRVAKSNRGDDKSRG